MEKHIQFASLAFIFSLILAAPCYAQTQLPEGRVADYNRHAWLVYNGDFRLTSRWGVHTEAQWRRANGLRDAQQNLVRAGLNYHLSNNLLLTGGYAFADTHPYGEYPAAKAFPEHRLYQQVLLRSNEGFLQVQHRYRLEQRWVRFANNPEYTYLNRARYQLRLAAPLLGPKLTAGMPYLVASNELFINFGNNVSRNIFDQNRAYAALGYMIRKNVNIEAGYLHQLVQQRHGTVFEHNNTLQLSLNLNLDLRKEGLGVPEIAPAATE
ncbi:DUF2490 domain-containing protein [Hymenobacter koreensis]|uniref:DUF2490 domain-containing protein n=1 Tax=Hymenobacter koreensis TaxID=1084523 RepID=A0ABP8IX44_9BACT